MPLGAYLRMIRFPFQFSIGDASNTSMGSGPCCLLCFNSLLEMHVAMSMVQARYEFSFNSLLEMPSPPRLLRHHDVLPVSILYWRCYHSTSHLAATAADVFQFSIGDARLLYATVTLEPYLAITSFNSLLEMQRKRREHEEERRRNLFQFSIGDASSRPADAD